MWEKEVKIMKKRFKWSTKINVQKVERAIFISTIVLIGFTYWLSERIKCALLFTIIFTVIATVFMIYTIKFLLNDLVDIEKFENNFLAYTFTYLVVLALDFYWYTRDNFDFEFFLLISVGLITFWLLYGIACTKILNKLNVGEKKIWCITVIKSVFASLGAWGTIAALLFSPGNSNKEKIFFLSMRILSAGAAFFYPIIDMYSYTHQKINEYQKSILKEK